MAISLRQLTSECQLIALTLIGSHVAATGVLRVGASLTALIRLQQVALPVSATERLARINRWASREQSLGLGRPAIVLQGPKHWVGVIEISCVVEITGGIAAQVVALGGDNAAAVSSRTAVCDNAIFEGCRAAVGDAAADGCAVPANGAAADRQHAATGADTATAVGCIPTDGAVIDHQVVGSDAAAIAGGAIPADGAVIDQRTAAPDAATGT